MRDYVEKHAPRPKNDYLRSHDWRPLVRYPIVRHASGARLLMGETYLRELLMTAPSLFRNARSDARRAYEKSFENYVVSVVAELGGVMREQALKRDLPWTTSVVDATVQTSAGILLVEAKAAFSHPLLRTNPTEEAARLSLRSTVRKGLLQLDDVSRALADPTSTRATHFTRGVLPPRIARLIVTPMDLCLGPRTGTGSTLDLLGSKSAMDLPTFVISIEDLETLVVSSVDNNRDVVDVLYEAYALEQHPGKASFNFLDYLRDLLPSPTRIPKTLAKEVEIALVDAQRAFQLPGVPRRAPPK